MLAINILYITPHPIYSKLMVDLIIINFLCVYIIEIINIFLLSIRYSPVVFRCIPGYGVAVNERHNH